MSEGRAPGRPEPGRVPGSITHLVDATMFWSASGGGVRRYLLAKHAWLAGQADWRHTIAVPAVAGAPAAGASDTATLPSWPLPGSGGYRLPVRRAAIARALRALAPDLIEAGDPYRTAWAVRDVAGSLGIPAVAYCHSNLETMARLAAGARLGGAAARLARRYARHVYAGFDLVLAPSRCLRQRLFEAGIASAAWQPLGVDTGVFRPRGDPLAWRRSLGLAADARVLVYAGRFAPEKHLGVLADAVERLGGRHVLVAIGAGPTPPPAGPRVRVLPFVASAAALAEALAGADAFVHAGDQETFGLSALEAMACGTPVVVRDAEGLGELVADSGAGLAVGRGDGAAFAEAIAAVLAGDRERLAARARAHAEANDWRRVLPGLLGMYRRLLDRGGVAGATGPQADRETLPAAADGTARAPARPHLAAASPLRRQPR